MFYNCLLNKLIIIENKNLFTYESPKHYSNSEFWKYWIAILKGYKPLYQTHFGTKLNLFQVYCSVLFTYLFQFVDLYISHMIYTPYGRWIIRGALKMTLNWREINYITILSFPKWSQIYNRKDSNKEPIFVVHGEQMG